jgi:lipopolysaccharide exporter
LRFLLRPIWSTLRARHNLRRHVWQSLANYIQSGGALFLGLILARLLTPDEFGRFAYVSAVVTAFMLPFTITFTPLLITNSGRDPGLLAKVLAVTCVVACLKVGVLLLYIVFSLWHNDRESAGLAFWIGTPFALSGFIDAFRADSEGKGFFRPNVMAQLLSLTTVIVISLGLVLTGWGVYGLAIAGFAAYWPQLIAYIYTASPGVRGLSLTFTGLSALWKSGFAFWASQLTTNVMARIDKIALGYFAGDVELGYYNRALNYAPFSILLFSAFITSSSVFAMRNQCSMRNRLLVAFKTSVILLLAALLNFVGLQWFSDPVVPFLFGAQWTSAIPAFQAFSWFGLACVLQFVPTNFLLACEANGLVAYGKLVALLALVCGLALLSHLQAFTAVHVALVFSSSTALSGIVLMFFAVMFVCKRRRFTGSVSYP